MLDVIASKEGHKEEDDIANEFKLIQPEFGAQIVILGHAVQNVVKGSLGGVTRLL